MTQAPTADYLKNLAELLYPAIYEAGAVIMDIHQRKISARLKPDGSPVSEADEAAEAILLPALAKVAPDIPPARQPLPWRRQQMTKLLVLRAVRRAA